jgi:hypothetical protein
VKKNQVYTVRSFCRPKKIPFHLHPPKNSFIRRGYSPADSRYTLIHAFFMMLAISNTELFMEVRHVASATITLASAAVAGSVYAAATATSGVAIATFAILATLLSAFTFASISAAFSDKSFSAQSYFSTVGEHLTVAIPAIFTVIGQALFKCSSRRCC